MEYFKVPSTCVHGAGASHLEQFIRADTTSFLRDAMRARSTTTEELPNSAGFLDAHFLTR